MISNFQTLLKTIPSAGDRLWIAGNGQLVPCKADFLKGLPSYNEQNFTKFNPESGCKQSSKRPPVYVCTKDHPAEQVITTEKTNILLRYLHQQWDKKNANKKRDSNRASLDVDVTSPANKMPRLSGESS